MSKRKKQRKKYIPSSRLKETVQPPEVSKELNLSKENVEAKKTNNAFSVQENLKKEITWDQDSFLEVNEQEVALLRKEHLVFVAIGSGFSIILYLVSFLV